MRRFLVLSQYFPPEIGASQMRLAAMIRELNRLGHTVEVVTGLPNHPTGQIFSGYRGLYLRDEWKGVVVHRVWLYPAVGAGVKRMLNYLSFMVTSLVGLFRAQRPDFLFVESPPLFLGLPAALMAWRWQVPLIFNVADLWPDSVKELGLMRTGCLLRFAERLETWCYRRASYVNAVTEGIREALVERKQVPSEKVLFLPNGVDVELFAPREDTLTQELALGTKQVILYAGTLGYAQGLEVAIDTMVRLGRDTPGACLVFIGDGSEKARLERMVKQLGLNNIIFLPPNSPEYVARLLSSALAGLVTLKDLPLFLGARPSKTFPIMACGRPVIYSGRGEGAELVAEADAGLVVPPGDPVALAEAIRYLCSHPAEASRLGANGRRYVKDNLSWTSLVERWLGELEDRIRG